MIIALRLDAAGVFQIPREKALCEAAQEDISFVVDT
jgi:hypothetical protein